MQSLMILNGLVYTQLLTTNPNNHYSIVYKLIYMTITDFNKNREILECTTQFYLTNVQLVQSLFSLSLQTQAAIKPVVVEASSSTAYPG